MTTKAEWKKYEEEMVEKVEAIEIPPDITAADVIRIHSEIDAVYSEARISFARLKFQVDSLNRRKKIAEREALKAAGDLPKEERPKNDKEREAFVIDYLQKNNLPGMKVDIYSAIEIASLRYEFIAGIVDILREKTERLSTMYGCIKLDAELDMNKSVRGAEKMANKKKKNDDDLQF